LDLQKKRYLLATVHRAENTDNSDRLRNVVKAFNSINEPIVFPAHPRTQKAIEALDLTISQNIRYIKPVGYLDMVRLEAGARMIMTDSGGVQKESYWLGVPCITLRKETEWTETVQTGWNQLVETDIDLIHQAINSHRIPESHPHLYGDGKTASMCIELLNLTEL